MCRACLSLSSKHDSPDARDFKLCVRLSWRLAATCLSRLTYVISMCSNAALIADLVGGIVGDGAGRGADLIASIAAHIIAALILRGTKAKKVLASSIHASLV